MRVLDAQTLQVEETHTGVDGLKTTEVHQTVHIHLHITGINLIARYHVRHMRIVKQR